MKKEKRRRFVNLAEKLVGDHDVPPELLCGGCFVEIRGRNAVVVRGCKRIIEYGTERVILMMHKNFLTIRGKRLTCITYFAGAVSIEGLVDTVEFSKDREENNEA